MAIRTGACGKKMIAGELILKIDSGQGNFPLINDKDMFAFKIEMPRYNDKAELIESSSHVQFKNQDTTNEKFRIKIRLAINNQNMVSFIF